VSGSRDTREEQPPCTTRVTAVHTRLLLARQQQRAATPVRDPCVWCGSATTSVDCPLQAARVSVGLLARAASATMACTEKTRLTAQPEDKPPGCRARTRTRTRAREQPWQLARPVCRVRARTSEPAKPEAGTWVFSVPASASASVSKPARERRLTCVADAYSTGSQRRSQSSSEISRNAR
jgi:hypothetical protein